MLVALVLQLEIINFLVKKFQLSILVTFLVSQVAELAKFTNLLLQGSLSVLYILSDFNVLCLYLSHLSLEVISHAIVFLGC